MNEEDFMFKDGKTINLRRRRVTIYFFAVEIDYLITHGQSMKIKIYSDTVHDKYTGGNGPDHGAMKVSECVLLDGTSITKK